MLHTLCYISNSVHLWQKDQLDNLFTYTKTSNASKNVTGLLVYNEGTFVQVLEGEKITVLNLFSQIKNDCRHNQITIMMDRPIDIRLFPTYRASAVFMGEITELKTLKSKMLLPKASKHAKSLLAILKPFFYFPQVRMHGYGA